MYLLHKKIKSDLFLTAGTGVLIFYDKVDLCFLG